MPHPAFSPPRRPALESVLELAIWSELFVVGRGEFFGPPVPLPHPYTPAWCSVYAMKHVPIQAF